MEENVIISNIATIITKDILFDQTPRIFINPTTYTLLDENEAEEDEAFNFFSKQFLNPPQPSPKQQKIQQQNAQDSSNKNNAPKSEVPQVVKGTPTTTSTAAATKDAAAPTKGQIKRRKVNVEVDVVASERRKGEISEEIEVTKRTELNLLNLYEPVEFEGFLHMQKMSFLKIFQSMRHLLLQAAFPKSISVQSIFSLALWKLTNDEHYEQISRKFKIPLDECQAYIRHFWQLISDNYETFIKWPNSTHMQQATVDNFQSHPKLKPLHKLFGVIALKRVDVFLENEDNETAVIVQIICNADQKIIDCHVELAKNYTFDGSPIGRTLELNKQTMPIGCYLVGDMHLPLKSYLMRPFEETCFCREEDFNQLLDAAVEMAYQTLDAMAKRFNILYAMEAKDLNEVLHIVETISALHNLCVSIEDDYVERKQGVIKFNWARTASVPDIKGNENDELGKKRRSELIEEIFKP